MIISYFCLLPFEQEVHFHIEISSFFEHHNHQGVIWLLKWSKNIYYFLLKQVEDLINLMACNINSKPFTVLVLDKAILAVKEPMQTLPIQVKVIRLLILIVELKDFLASMELKVDQVSTREKKDYSLQALKD